jgi:hypothetical protein
MTAATANDDSGVEYYFTCTAGGGNDSDWQNSDTYTDTDLQAETQYTYTVKARDLSANQNTTSASASSSATTDPAPQQDTALVAHWSLDEGSGAIAYDSTGTNDGAIHGAEWVAGEIGGALSFNGSSDYIDFGNDINLQITDEMSISAWIKTSSSNRQFIVSKDNLANRCYSLFLVNGIVRFQIFKGNVFSRVNSSASVNDGNWHHVVVVNDGTNLEIHIDGVLKGTNYGGGGTVDNDNVDMWIGARNDLSDFFNGSIDAIKLFEKALLADDVLLLYNESTP